MTYDELMGRPLADEPPTPPEGFVLCSAEEAARHRHSIKWCDGVPSFVAVRRCWMGYKAYTSQATTILYARPI